MSENITGALLFSIIKHYDQIANQGAYKIIRDDRWKELNTKTKRATKSVSKGTTKDTNLVGFWSEEPVSVREREFSQ